jgi:hypothetical protein
MGTVCKTDQIASSGNAESKDGKFVYVQDTMNYDGNSTTTSAILNFATRQR